MTRVILLILIFCSISVVKAQKTDSLFKKQYIRIGTGFSKHIVRDDIVSPMVYKGSTVPIWLEYKTIKPKWIESCSAFFGKSDLKSNIPEDFSNHHSKNINGYFGYSLLRKVYSSNTCKTDIYAGGKFETFIHYRMHYYASNVNEVTADLNSSLDIQFSFVKRFDKIIDGVTYRINMPVVTFAALPKQYNIKVAEQFYGFVFPDRLFEFQSEFSIHKSINKCLTVGVSSFVHYYSFKKNTNNRTTKYFNNQIVADLIFAF